MAQAGWCAACESNVWLAEDGGCVKGHGAEYVSGVYEAAWEGDGPFDEAMRSIEEAAERAGMAIKEAWDDATPRVKEAWQDAAPAMKRAGDAVGRAAEEFGAGVKAFGLRVSRPEADAAPPDPPEKSSGDDRVSS